MGQDRPPLAVPVSPQRPRGRGTLCVFFISLGLGARAGRKMMYLCTTRSGQRAPRNCSLGTPAVLAGNRTARHARAPGTAFLSSTVSVVQSRFFPGCRQRQSDLWRVRSLRRLVRSLGSSGHRGHAQRPAAPLLRRAC